MGRLKQKGKAGAAKAYVTRSYAVKKLQCSLADFRRLCILKGIFPREPRHRKRANKGSSAPTSFYYAKDISYLAHEPVLKKLREHKAFAKKISRAIGRGEWSTAKSLDDNKPTYRLDHIIKERYPTFTDAVRDIDDALCMIFLFANLPSDGRVSPSLIENCSRLAAEWQLYVMHTRSLRKVFLSIKGIYYQAEVMDQTVTWVVPYQFTQNVPSDVDVRVMLTFLELYQTVLGFVFFKLYTDAGLVYPPPLDQDKDAAAAGVGAFHLKEVDHNVVSKSEKTIGKSVSSKEVRQTIKSIGVNAPADDDADMDAIEDIVNSGDVDEDFVAQVSKSNDISTLPTLQSISSLPQLTPTKLFEPYTFFLSRESSRTVFEFLVRSFGGRMGWPATLGSGSPISEDDETITHVIIDRPIVQKSNESAEERDRRLRRKYVQPQWVVDCINAGKILLEDLYAQGKPLPPHLSPFAATPGAYDPMVGPTAEEIASEEDVGDEVVDEEGDAEERAEDEDAPEVEEVTKEVAVGGEDDMNKMMMSKRKRNLYERMKYGERKRAAENATLEEKRQKIAKDKKRQAKR